MSRISKKQLRLKAIWAELFLRYRYDVCIEIIAYNTSYASGVWLHDTSLAICRSIKEKAFGINQIRSSLHTESNPVNVRDYALY